VGGVDHVCAGGCYAPAGDVDAGDLDAGGVDAGEVIDSGAGRDAEAPWDSGPPDGGIDCSVIGCGAPTVCGMACGAPCGCCPCGDGEMITLDGRDYVCVGGCYVATTGGLGPGEVCTAHGDCRTGLSCCYPCGIAGCDNVCEPSCDPGTPGCFGGCLPRA